MGFVVGVDFGVAGEAGLGAEGAVEGIADGDAHPGGGGDGHVGGFGEAVALEDSGGEEIELVGEGEVGLVDIAEDGGGSALEEDGGPGVVLAEGGGAEGVEVAGDGSLAEFHAGIGEGAVGLFGVPAEVDGGVAHGVVVGEAGLVGVDDGGDAIAGGGGGDVLDPLFAGGVGSLGLLGEIDVGFAPEAGFFGGDGVGDEGAGGGVGDAVDPADEDHPGEGGFAEGGVLAVVAVFVGSVAGEVVPAEEHELGVYGGLVLLAGGGLFIDELAGLGVFYFGSVFFCDAEGDVAHEGDDFDFVGGGAFCAVGFGELPPAAFGELLAEGVADPGFVFLAGDGFFLGAV